MLPDEKAAELHVTQFGRDAAREAGEEGSLSGEEEKVEDGGGREEEGEGVWGAM